MALPTPCHWNVSSRARQVPEAAASRGSSTKQMLVKKRNKKEKKKKSVIYRYHWIITSESLPRSSEDPMCKTAHGEELRKLELGHCQSFSSFGFHWPNCFSVNTVRVAKGFHWTTWYHSVFAPVAIYHPLKTEQHCLNWSLTFCQYSCGGKVSGIHLESQLPSAAEPAHGAFATWNTIPPHYNRKS